MFIVVRQFEISKKVLNRCWLLTIAGNKRLVKINLLFNVLWQLSHSESVRHSFSWNIQKHQNKNAERKDNIKYHQ